MFKDHSTQIAFAKLQKEIEDLTGMVRKLGDLHKKPSINFVRGASLIVPPHGLRFKYYKSDRSNRTVAGEEGDVGYILEWKETSYCKDYSAGFSYVYSQKTETHRAYICFPDDGMPPTLEMEEDIKLIYPREDDEEE